MPSWVSSRVAAGAVLAALSVSCIPTKAKQPAPPGELDLAGGVNAIAADLGRQLGRRGTRTLVIDPLLERASGQQTGASQRVEQALGPALTSAIGGLAVVPFDASGVSKAGLVLSGTIAVVQAPDRYAVSVALTDPQSGVVVAQSAARFREAGLDNSPTRLYSDSPSLVRDRSVDGYVKTAETPAGNLADPLYVEQIPTAAVLAQALAAYNAGQWEQALAGYSAAADRPDGQQLRTFNGLYLCNVRLGRLLAAEQAFGRIVALGFATDNLAVKLLFQPGSSNEFWPNPELSGMYPMWLRQIAHAARASSSCLSIIGHTSRSGSESLNDRLSLARAESIRSRLEAEEPNLKDRIRVTGVGYSQNIVGTGADDASDAIDRRVEFKVMACGPGRGRGQSIIRDRPSERLSSSVDPGHGVPRERPGARREAGGEVNRSSGIAHRSGYRRASIPDTECRASGRERVGEPGRGQSIIRNRPSERLSSSVDP